MSADEFAHALGSGVEEYAEKAAPTADKDAGHGVHCDGCLMLGFVTRLEKAEAQIDALTRALHLANVGVEPTAKWLDTRMAEIEARYTTVTPPGSGRDS